MEDLITSTTKVVNANLPMDELVPNLTCFGRNDYVL